MVNWRKGPAQGEKPEVFCGVPYLVALTVRDRDRKKSWWEMAVIAIEEDGTAKVDGEYWGWEWSDVEFYCPAKELETGLPDAKSFIAQPADIQPPLVSHV